MILRRFGRIGFSGRTGSSSSARRSPLSSSLDLRPDGGFGALLHRSEVTRARAIVDPHEAVELRLDGRRCVNRGLQLAERLRDPGFLPFDELEPPVDFGELDPVLAREFAVVRGRRPGRLRTIKGGDPFPKVEDGWAGGRENRETLLEKAAEL